MCCSIISKAPENITTQNNSHSRIHEAHSKPWYKYYTKYYHKIIVQLIFTTTELGQNKIQQDMDANFVPGETTSPADQLKAHGPHAIGSAQVC